MRFIVPFLFAIFFTSFVFADNWDNWGDDDHDHRRHHRERDHDRDDDHDRRGHHHDDEEWRRHHHDEEPHWAWGSWNNYNEFSVNNLNSIYHPTFARRAGKTIYIASGGSPNPSTSNQLIESFNAWDLNNPTTISATSFTTVETNAGASSAGNVNIVDIAVFEDDEHAYIWNLYSNGVLAALNGPTYNIGSGYTATSVSVNREHAFITATATVGGVATGFVFRVNLRRGTVGSLPVTGLQTPAQSAWGDEDRNELFIVDSTTCQLYVLDVARDFDNWHDGEGHHHDRDHHHHRHHEGEWWGGDEEVFFKSIFGSTTCSESATTLNKPVSIYIHRNGRHRSAYVGSNAASAATISKINLHERTKVALTIVGHTFSDFVSIIPLEDGIINDAGLNFFVVDTTTAYVLAYAATTTYSERVGNVVLTTNAGKPTISAAGTIDTTTNGGYAAVGVPNARQGIVSPSGTTVFVQGFDNTEHPLAGHTTNPYQYTLYAFPSASLASASTAAPTTTVASWYFQSHGYRFDPTNTGNLWSLGTDTSDATFSVTGSYPSTQANPNYYLTLINVLSNTVTGSVQIQSNAVTPSPITAGANYNDLELNWAGDIFVSYGTVAGVGGINYITTTTATADLKTSPAWTLGTLSSLPLTGLASVTGLAWGDERRHRLYFVDGLNCQLYSVNVRNPAYATDLDVVFGISNDCADSDVTLNNPSFLHINTREHIAYVLSSANGNIAVINLHDKSRRTLTTVQASGYKYNDLGSSSFWYLPRFVLNNNADSYLLFGKTAVANPPDSSAVVTSFGGSGNQWDLSIVNVCDDHATWSSNVCSGHW